MKKLMILGIVSLAFVCHIQASQQHGKTKEETHSTGTATASAASKPTLKAMEEVVEKHLGVPIISKPEIMEKLYSFCISQPTFPLNQAATATIDMSPLSFVEIARIVKDGIDTIAQNDQWIRRILQSTQNDKSSKVQLYRTALATNIPKSVTEEMLQHTPIEFNERILHFVYKSRRENFESQFNKIILDAGKSVMYKDCLISIATNALANAVFNNISLNVSDENNDLQILQRYNDPILNLFIAQYKAQRAAAHQQ